MAKQENTPLTYQIKVTLKDSHPPIWRRILLPADISLYQLHRILQVVFEWEDYHLHNFYINDLEYGNPANDDSGMFGIRDEKDYQLSQVVNREGARFSYTYDFGDDWDHTLLVEKIFHPKQDQQLPVVIKGKRAGPPEDVGGVWGYEEFLEAIKNPDHPAHESYLEWIGDDFDPEAFDLDAINEMLRALLQSRDNQTDNQEGDLVVEEIIEADDFDWDVEEFLGENGDDFLELVEDLDEDEIGLWESPWEGEPPETIMTGADQMKMRYDILILMKYLDEHRLIGTKKNGDFPLKDVRNLLDELSVHIEEFAQANNIEYKVRRETDVPPLYLLHLLASAGGLIDGGPGEQWLVTDVGEDFITSTPAEQAWQLFASWWLDVSWMQLSPFPLPIDFPDEVKAQVLNLFLQFPVDEMVPLSKFTYLLIGDEATKVPLDNREEVEQMFNALIQMMIVYPLANLGVLIPKLNQEGIGNMGAEMITAFQVTPFGRELLEYLRNY